jgi:thiol-disulfide isomerase/thioredoxin
MKAQLLTCLVLIAALPGLAVADPAPPLSLQNAAGQIVELPRQHESVDIYLFWATWCPYCKAFMPHIQSIRDEYGDAVTVYALQIRDDEDPRPFMTENGFDFELIPNADAAMEPYGMRGTPGLVLVDGEGEIRFNLYEVVLQDPPGYADLGNRAKAARRGPAWAARVRQEIDAILTER